MSEYFQFEENVDLMSHDAVLVEADININRYDYPGIKDRRFKTGYRVMPQSGVNLVINNFIVERNDRYQLRQYWQVGEPNTIDDLGKFCVVDINIETVKLIPLSLSQNKDKVNFKMKPKLELKYYGSMFMGEGSSTPRF